MFAMPSRIPLGLFLGFEHLAVRAVMARVGA
jgi:hypothetical protein